MPNKLVHADSSIFVLEERGPDLLEGTFIGSDFKPASTQMVYVRLGMSLFGKSKACATAGLSRSCSMLHLDSLPVFCGSRVCIICRGGGGVVGLGPMSSLFRSESVSHQTWSVLCGCLFTNSFTSWQIYKGSEGMRHAYCVGCAVVVSHMPILFMLLIFNRNNVRSRHCANSLAGFCTMFLKEGEETRVCHSFLALQQLRHQLVQQVKTV